MNRGSSPAALYWLAAMIAAGERDEVVERVLAEGDATVGTEAAREAAFRVREGTSDDGRDILVGERLQSPHAEAGEQGSIDLEVRILGRRTDQRHGAVFDVRQERVLLGLVESMDLVDEQDAADAVQRQPLLGLGDRRPDLGHARHDCGQGVEMRTDLAGQQSREARLPGPGRTPQQQRRQVAASDAPPQRSLLADQVVLPDELGQPARSHPRGERLSLGRWLEERLGPGAPGSGSG